MWTARLLLALVVGSGAAVSCGTENVHLDGDRTAKPSPCTPGASQCSNCADDDGDNLVDGDDPECTGGLDDREDSFATDIPGDNSDPVKQDCFFDGNSGSGDDRCELHTCCSLDVPCPPAIDSGFDPEADCAAQSSQCADNCAPLAPPGCDCFGCCTICDPSEPGDCRDIFIHPAVSPDCVLASLADPDVCLSCRKSAECSGGACDPERCILCPGQDEDDLPDHCRENNCPQGQTRCDTGQDCAADQYCSHSCCIDITVD